MAEQLEQITELDERIETDEVDEGKRLWHGIVALVVLCVLVGALLTAVPGLRAVADRLSDVNRWWIVLAVVLELGSCIGYVLVFQHIFYRAPPLFAARVALSEMAFSAVIPAGGAGGIALGAYIVKAKGGPVRRFAERSRGCWCWRSSRRCRGSPTSCRDRAVPRGGPA